MTSSREIRAWCQESGFHPNRTLGQNFLVDRIARDRILDCADIADGENVLEVGPGLGALTEGLLERGARVTAIEKDSVLAARLASSLGEPPALSVVAGDALDLAKNGALDGFPKMVSNLPYQSGTRILLELIRRIDLPAGPADRTPATIVVLVQTEVAERLAAGPGSKTRGLAGVWVQLDYNVQLVRTVAPGCFWPRPEVESTVVKLTRHHGNDSLGTDERNLFRRIVKRAFEHRRKQLGSIFKGLVQSAARPEDLSNEEWIELMKGLPDDDT